MTTRLVLGPCIADLLRQTLTWPDRHATLSAQEAQLLSHLAAHEGRVVSREELLVRVWGHRRDSLSRAVDKAVNRLRAKVELDPARPRHLVTVHGEGYRLVLGDDDAQPGSGAARMPVPLDRFVGRSSEAAEVHALLGRGRLVTITGPGGMGKTRLAIELCRRLPGPVAFVDGAALQRGEALPAAMAAALEVAVTGATPEEHLNQLTACAARREELLVLDNMEHLTQVGPQLVRLLEDCPRLRVLATSRRPLGVRGEAVFELGPLGADDAAVLLRARARQLDRDESVPALVALLEGIPLAVELAAARCSAASAAELVADLRAGRGVLEDAAIGRPERHRTLDAAIDGSWGLLTPEEQHALARLTVFEGGFSRAAAARVLRVAPEAATELLGRFRDLALLRVETSSAGLRFSFFRCIHERVLSHLRPGPDATQAHAEYFLDWSREQLARAEGPDWQDALLQLGGEGENLLAAADRCLPDSPSMAAELALAVAPVDGVKGTAPAGLLGLMDRIPVDALPPVEARRLAVFLARARQWSLPAEEALPPFEALCAEARRAGDMEALVGATLGRSRSLHRLGRNEDAADAVREALAVMGDDPRRRGTLLVEQGVFLGKTGDPSAMPLIRDGLALIEGAGAAPLLPRSLSQLASAVRRQGRIAEAAAALQRATALRPPWDRRGRVADLGQLGLLLPLLGRRQEGHAAFDAAIEVELALGRTAYAAQHAVNQALACLSSVDEVAAATALRRARTLSARADEPRLRLEIDRCEVLVAALELRWPDARALCEGALTHAMVRGRVVQESIWLGCSIPVRAFAGDFAGARSELDTLRTHEASARFDEVRHYCVFLAALIEALERPEDEPDWTSAEQPVGLTGELVLGVSIPEVRVWMEAYSRWSRFSGVTAR